jgi:hypothetical protein
MLPSIQLWRDSDARLRFNLWAFGLMQPMQLLHTGIAAMRSASLKTLGYTPPAMRGTAPFVLLSRQV